jgi:branched-chain amino acid transport system ATP-binding protein
VYKFLIFRWQPLLFVLFALSICGLLPLVLGEYYIHILILMSIAAVFAMSLDILMGYAGLPSLGHAAFLGIAAYGAGLVTARYSGGWTVGLLLGLLSSVILSATFGLIALRVRGLYFLLITLALAQTLWGAANRWGSFTGGYNGLRGIPKFLEIGGTTIGAFYAVITIAITLGALMYLVTRSPFGMSLQGLRDSETRMQALGYNVWLHKYLAFIISAVFAGCAGVLSAFYKGFVSPFDLSLAVSAEAMLMVILGGSGTLIGPILGAIVIVALRNLLSVFMDHWLIVLGFIFVLTVFVAPNGIVAWFKLPKKKLTLKPSNQQRSEQGTEVVVNEAVVARNQKDLHSKSELIDKTEQQIALKISGLSKSFGGMVAVKAATFSISEGERVAILGPNGAGKSTLFNLISGHLRPSAGSIELFGTSIDHLPSYQRTRKGLGRTFQITNLFGSLSVIENVRIALASTYQKRTTIHRFANYFSIIERKAVTILSDANLSNISSNRVDELSYGEQRQLEFVMALALRPRVLLLDEPTAGLSVSETKLIVDLINRLDPKLAVIIIEHDLDVALNVAERVIVFHHGEKLTDGTPKEILEDKMIREIYLGKIGSD